MHMIYPTLLHWTMQTFSVHDTEDEEEALNAVLEAREAEANYAHDLSDAAALEHVVSTLRMRMKKRPALHLLEEHYKSIDKDIKTIEHLIQEADKYDHSEVSKDESNNDLFLILM